MKKNRIYGNQQQFDSEGQPMAEDQTFEQQNETGAEAWESKSGGGGGSQSKKYESSSDQETEFEGEEGGEGVEGKASKIKEVSQKVLEYLKESDLDKEQLLKYGALAVLTLVGMRKTGLVGGLLMTAAIGLVTKYVLAEEKKEEAASK